jgi:hypothetical protein
MLLSPFYEASILIAKPDKDMEKEENDSTIFLMNTDTKV